MEPQLLDMAAYPRKTHFDYFRGLAYPYVGVTVPVKVTGLARALKENGLPFFFSFLYCAARAANGVPEFRQRIRGEGIVQYEACRTSHTVALEDGTFCYCTLNASMPFFEFLPYAANAQGEAKRAARATDNADEAEELLFVSCTPWLAYTAITQPVPMPADSNPRITWGRFAPQGEELTMPVSVLCHHALVDGLHIARFYERLGEEMEALAAQLTRL